MEAILKANESMIEATSKVKKQKVQQASLSHMECVAMRLWDVQKDLRKNYDDAGLSAIEVEVRVGMIVDNYRRWKSRSPGKTAVVVDPRSNPSLRFRAGVDHIFARRLRSKLSDQMFHCAVQPLQIMRCDESDNRWTVNSKGELMMAEKKQALDQINLALIAHEYDIRINVATEIAAPLTDSTDPSVLAATGPPVNRAMWVVERRKKRTSYTCKDPHMNKWRIDYTEVDIITKAAGAATPSGKIKKEIEVEFELEHAPMLEWLREKDDQQVINKTKILAGQLIHLLDYCIPFESEAEKEASLLVVNDTYFDMEINKLDMMVKPDAVQAGRKKSDFIGAMPVNLTRQNFMEVQKTDYFITEKSDGIRYLMYVVPAPRATDPSDCIAVLVDRSKTIFKFRGCETVGKALGVGVILDGELVFNRSLKENVFLVFDALLYRGQPLVDKLFGERLETIRTTILTAFARNLPAVLAHESALNAHRNLPTLPGANPLQLVRKVFVPRREFNTLLSKMRLEEGERVFFDPENRAAAPGAPATSRRHHKSDGFIFQPNARYVFSKHYELMKWKWAELRSVDLQIEIPMEATSNAAGGDWPIYLKCGGPDGTQINCTKRGDTNVGLGEFDTYRLLADMESPELANRNTQSPPIVEVAYDISIGMWSYLHLRKDKDKPNFIDSVMGVFMEQAESISIEELEYSLSASSHGLENDYEVQIEKMKAKLLVWQRSEVARKNGAAVSAPAQRK